MRAATAAFSAKSDRLTFHRSKFFLDVNGKIAAFLILVVTASLRDFERALRACRKKQIWVRRQA